MPDSKRILIVDDNMEDRDAVRRYLRQDTTCAYEFEEQDNVKDGLTAVARNPPDCVLIDYSLPDGNGLQFLEKVAHLTMMKSLGVVMLTGTGDEMIAVQAMKAGAHDYLIKGKTTAESLRLAVRGAVYKANTERVLDAQREELERLYRETRETNRRQGDLLQELQLAKDYAEAANSAKDRFLATLSHELRTPLTPVLSSVSSMLQESALSDDFRAMCEMIRRNIGLEARLIDDLLDLTRIARGKLVLEMQAVDLHSCIRDAIEICRSDFETKQIGLKEKLEATSTTVLADPARMHQVYWNLLKNAVKFTPAGGEVIISSWNESGEIVASVRDSGIGIAPENMPKIFNAFEQGDTSTAQRFGGLGLGLAISKALVSGHGGKISVNSKGLNQGTVFTTRLNVASHLRVRPAEPIPEPMAETNCGGRSCRVLLVEDHPDSAAALSRALRRRGFDVVPARSVAEGAQMYHPSEIDLLICDIGLPDGTGLDLMEKLRGHGPIKAIALSGFGMDHDLKRSREAGFAAHLTKPVDFQRLVAVVDEILSN